MSTADYKYVENERATKYPIWGTEIALIERKTRKGNHATVTITTARFDPSEEHDTGMLIGNRTIWYVDDDIMKAAVTSIQSWTAEGAVWNERWDLDRVPFRHHSVLSNMLMARWDKGKLRGRITNTLERPEMVKGNDDL